MDIFKWADDNNWMADYMDMHTGYIYHVSQAPDHDTILVSCDGELIGQVTRNKDEA